MSTSPTHTITHAQKHKALHINEKVKGLHLHLVLIMSDKPKVTEREEATRMDRYRSIFCLLSLFRYPAPIYHPVASLSFLFAFFQLQRDFLSHSFSSDSSIVYNKPRLSTCSLNMFRLVC